MIISCGDYELRPYSNGLCWELWKYDTVNKRTGEKVKEWVSTGAYPSTIEHGLTMIYERTAKDCPYKMQLRSAIIALREIGENIAKSARGDVKNEYRR